MARRTRPAEWSRLDNIAKIFPPTTTARDPKVFRWSCCLYETVDPEILQQALDKALISFPHFKTVLRRGLFWYYFDASTLPAIVHQENLPPCAPLYDPTRKSLLFRVSYWMERINFEVYHALTDGAGGLQFLRLLVYEYLLQKYAGQFHGGAPVLDYNVPAGLAGLDSFQKYYDHLSQKKHKRALAAYHITGARLPEYRLRVIQGEMYANALLEKAHAYHTTITGLVCGLLIHAIHAEMSNLDQKKPVVLTVPVNLRNYFPSGSARNFFGIMNLHYRFCKREEPLEDILDSLNSQMREELTEEKLSERIHFTGWFERQYWARFSPLALKDIVLKQADRISKREVTGAVSNLGKVSMPEPLCQYIRSFEVMNSTNRVQVCLCSFQNRLVISFTSPFVKTDLHTHFFRALADMGIPVLIRANQPEEG